MEEDEDIKSACTVSTWLAVQLGHAAISDTVNTAVHRVIAHRKFPVISLMPKPGRCGRDLECWTPLEDHHCSELVMQRRAISEITFVCANHGVRGSLLLKPRIALQFRA